MELAAQPERIEAELVQRREDAEKDQHLALQALAGLQRELVRLQRQKAELVELTLNRDRVGSVLTREEYETKASQMAAEINRLESQSPEKEQHNSAESDECVAVSSWTVNSTSLIIQWAEYTQNRAGCSRSNSKRGKYS